MGQLLPDAGLGRCDADHQFLDCLAHPDGHGPVVGLEERAVVVAVAAGVVVGAELEAGAVAVARTEIAKEVMILIEDAVNQAKAMSPTVLALERPPEQDRAA